MSDAPAPELSLDRYTILERVGEGGMASVYLARRDGSPEPVIIKVLHQHMADNDVVAHRFLREAQVAATLDHPNIAKLSDAGRQGEVFYIAMEHISGQELERVMHQHIRERRRLPPEVVMTISADVLAGLHYAHEFRDSEGSHLRIVHRDLSPRNVLVGFDGRAQIIDFGLVRTNLGEFRTAPGMVMGTLRYMSPEQAVADPVDHRSDTYTWAVVLWEALTGHLLIPNGKASDILKEVVVKTPAPVSSLNPALPKALDPVIAKALEKRREDRFESAEEMAAALKKAAPALVTHPPLEVGAYIASVFPGEAQMIEERLDRARLANLDVEHTVIRDAPEWELTRAGPALAMADPSAPGVEMATRVFDPAEDVAAEHFEATAYAPGLGSVDRPVPGQSQIVAPSQTRGKLIVIAALTIAVAVLATMLWSEPSTELREAPQEVSQLPPDRPAPGVAARATPAAAVAPPVQKTKRAPVRPKAPPPRLTRRPPPEKAKAAPPIKRPPPRRPRGPSLSEVRAQARADGTAKNYERLYERLRGTVGRLKEPQRSKMKKCLARADGEKQSLGNYSGRVTACINHLGT